jgi:hypothetical protein
MPYALEYWKSKAIVVNTKTGHHFSTEPLPEMKAKRQLKLLRAIEHNPDFKRRKK